MGIKLNIYFDKHDFEYYVDKSIKRNLPPCEDEETWERWFEQKKESLTAFDLVCLLGEYLANDTTR